MSSQAIGRGAAPRFSPPQQLFEAAENGWIANLKSGLGGDPASETNQRLINARHERGMTLLYHAVVHGNLESVECLLERKADPNEKWEGYTPLFFASERGHLDMVKCLLAADASHEPCGEEGLTPFHIACSRGELAVAEALLKSRPGEERKAFLGQTSRCGRNTPMHFAARHGQSAMVSWLMENGAPAEELSGSRLTPLQLAQANREMAAVKDISRYNDTIALLEQPVRERKRIQEEEIVARRNMQLGLTGAAIVGVGGFVIYMWPEPCRKAYNASIEFVRDHPIEAGIIGAVFSGIVAPAARDMLREALGVRQPAEE
ncbi:MAG: ankyrin repeat domain-containing protein [Verrucomicrobia bacterium]|nr:ankyrin repeat domain-containing protein [Verrucomicrobiota bacterium]